MSFFRKNRPRLVSGQKTLSHEYPPRAVKSCAVPPVVRGIVGMVLLLLAALGILVSVVNLGMKDVTAPHIRTGETAPSATDGYEAILVLGAGLRPDGSPSAMLSDRILTACELYRRAPGEKPYMLMSGDRTGSYDEVSAMRDMALREGVREEDILTDFAGYSTFESVTRASRQFGLKRILIVTQEYHLYRAMYIARECGMEADGVPADRRPYAGHVKHVAREWLARFKDFFVSARLV